MPEELKKEKKKIIASGNGLRKNAGLVRAVERQFGMPVSFSECEEEAAFGAARYAAEAVKGDA
jgi:sedoheptulokinase